MRIEGQFASLGKGFAGPAIFSGGIGCKRWSDSLALERTVRIALCVYGCDPCARACEFGAKGQLKTPEGDVCLSVEGAS